MDNVFILNENGTDTSRAGLLRLQYTVIRREPDRPEATLSPISYWPGFEPLTRHVTLRAYDGYSGRIHWLISARTNHRNMTSTFNLPTHQ